MSAVYIRKQYGVSYKRGDRIRIDGRPGVIVSFPRQYIGVRFDGDRHTTICHPTWCAELIEETDR